jgi:primosomal protein N' (replication factor Y)
MAEFLDIVFDVPVDSAFTYKIDENGSAGVGQRVSAPFGRRAMTGFVVGERETLPPGLEISAVKTIGRVIDKQAVFDARDVELARWMADFYLCGWGQALSAMLPSGKRESGFSSFMENKSLESSPNLSEEQSAALNAITAPDSGQTMFYLYGITGSGKTEVFLRAAEDAIKRGKSVIYLVPEIALTMQTADMIANRFGGISTVFHSALPAGARFTEWMRIRRGEVRIVIGPRSAVFAPVRDLGLIVIDEEHDGSYKSGNTPRYHARQVAMRRRAREGARLVMGSATPSVEAWRLMETNSGIKRFNLTKRLAGGDTPEIRIAPLEASGGRLTRALKEEIRKTASMGRQTILFLNRRGFAYFFHCPDCGFELICKRCSVSLTYHKAKNRAVCHYCGYSEIPPDSCPQCGSLKAGYAGFGTESIEEETRRTFPDLRVARADADSIGEKKGKNGEKSLKETLDDFRNGEIDILLGTQMVAKGLNFPKVRLVGVVLADTGLHIPDFRAVERTFSLIVQVAGRSGRYFPDGKVIVQTMRPSDPVIIQACALDVEGFFREEILRRETLKFPPFSRLIRFTFRSKDADRAEKAARRLADIMLTLLPADADMLGPVECPIGLIAGNYRFQIILRGKTLSGVHIAARKALALAEKGRDARVYVEIDVDPINLM